MGTKTWDEMDGTWIDSRDVIERLRELEDAASEEPNDLGCAACGEGSHPDDEIPALDPECATELRLLRAVNEEGAESYEDWQYGVVIDVAYRPEGSSVRIVEDRHSHDPR